MSTLATNSLNIMPAPETLDLIQKVDAFYNTSWNHLLIYSGIIITTIGVLLPLLIQYYQSRSLRREEDASIAKLNSLVATAIDDFSAQIRAEADQQKSRIDDQLKRFESMLAQTSESLKLEIRDKTAETRKSLEEQVQATTASIYHVQAGIMLSQKRYAQAAESYFSAAINFAKGKDELTLRRALGQITEKCLPEMNKEMIEASNDIPGLLKSLLGKLNELNENGRYTDAIARLKDAHAAAAARAKPA